MSSNAGTPALESVKVPKPVSELLVAFPGISGGALLGALLPVGLPARWFDFADPVAAMLAWLGVFLLVVGIAVGCWYYILGGREFRVRDQSLVIHRGDKVLAEVSISQIEQIQVLAPKVLEFNPLAWFLPQFGGVKISLRDKGTETFFVRLLLSRSSTAEAVRWQFMRLVPEPIVASEIPSVEGNSGTGSWPS